MSRTLVLAALLLCAVLMAGCHTVNGVVEDYKEAQKADVWLQDNLW